MDYRELQAMPEWSMGYNDGRYEECDRSEEFSGVQLEAYQLGLHEGWMDS